MNSIITNMKNHLYETKIEFQKHFLGYILIWFVLYFLPNKVLFVDDSVENYLSFNSFLLFIVATLYNILLVLYIKDNLLANKRSIKDYLALTFKKIISYFTTFLAMMVKILPLMFVSVAFCSIINMFFVETSFANTANIISWILGSILIYIVSRKYIFATIIYLISGLKNFEATRKNKKIANNNGYLYDAVLLVVFVVPVLIAVAIEIFIEDMIINQIVTIPLQILSVALNITIVAFILKNVDIKEDNIDSKETNE